MAVPERKGATENCPGHSNQSKKEGNDAVHARPVRPRAFGKYTLRGQKEDRDVFGAHTIVAAQ